MGPGEIHYAVLVVLIITLIAVVLSFTSAYYQAKIEIAKYNKAAIESCIVTSCDISFLGELFCTTTDIRDDINLSQGYIAFNFSK